MLTEEDIDVSDVAVGQRGRLTVDQLRNLVERGLIETVIVGFTDHYGRLLGGSSFVYGR